MIIRDQVSGGRGPLAPFRRAWDYRRLILRLAARDIEGRFRGSLLGKLWAIIVPLAMLAMYTFVFGFLLHIQWGGMETSKFQVPLLYFVGLILFDFFFECINRAPTLMIEHAVYIKKIVFPVEILAWVVVLVALFRVVIGGALLLLFYLVIDGLPPPSALAAPLIILPLAVIALGLVLFLSALGVYVRDFRQVITVIAPAIMFLSPIFFPLATVAAPFRRFFYLSPLTFPAESIRAALFLGEWPNGLGALAYVLAAWLVAWAGYAWFMTVREGFSDVV